MKGAPLTKHEALDAIQITVNAVDERGRELDRIWGLGRLTALVPMEWADRFRSQQRKFSAAVWEYEPDNVRRHGEAMLRAYDKLDELARASGKGPVPVDQWEFESENELIVLVRHISDTAKVQLDGRKATVWSLEEVENVIRRHPLIVAAKNAFPGCTVESVRPDYDTRHMPNDLLTEIPFD